MAVLLRFNAKVWAYRCHRARDKAGVGMGVGGGVGWDGKLLKRGTTVTLAWCSFVRGAPTTMRAARAHTHTNQICHYPAVQHGPRGDLYKDEGQFGVGGAVGAVEKVGPPLLDHGREAPRVGDWVNHVSLALVPKYTGERLREVERVKAMRTDKAWRRGGSERRVGRWGRRQRPRQSSQTLGCCHTW